MSSIAYTVTLLFIGTFGVVYKYLHNPFIFLGVIAESVWGDFGFLVMRVSVSSPFVTVGPFL